MPYFVIETNRPGDPAPLPSKLVKVIAGGFDIEDYNYDYYDDYGAEYDSSQWGDDSMWADGPEVTHAYLEIA